MKTTISFVLILVTMLALTGCDPQNISGEARVWLDVPLSGLTVPVNEQVKIEGHASSRASVARIEISINNSLWQVLDAPTCQDNLCSFNSVWQPDQPGVYTIQVVAMSADGEASNPDDATLTIGPLITDTPTPTFTPTITSTFTPTATFTPTLTPTITPTVQLKPQIQFWAEPAEITAGQCTTIKWSASNVKKVQFGGIDQPLVGADPECPCESKTYTLKVTLLDGSTTEKTASVAVNGSCVTSDTTPPSVPVLQVPADGLSIACKTTQTLSWLPVTDPSGIREYQVKVERSSDNVHWNPISISPITGLPDKTTNIGVECGWYYRWSVRAIDGAGNMSAWSEWFDFVVNLS